MTAQFKIVNMERDATTGFVNTVHWEMVETAGEFSGRVYGSIGLEGELVTPFEQLTEAQVVQWVEEAMGAETLAAHEANVAAQIQAQKNPVTASGTPWSD